MVVNPSYQNHSHGYPSVGKSLEGMQRVVADYVSTDLDKFLKSHNIGKFVCLDSPRIGLHQYLRLLESALKAPFQVILDLLLFPLSGLP